MTLRCLLCRCPVTPHPSDPHARTILCPECSDAVSEESWYGTDFPAKKTRKPTKRELALEAMRQAAEDELTALIRHQFALPMNKRTNFLRIRLPNGGSCL